MPVLPRQDMRRILSHPGNPIRPAIVHSPAEDSPEVPGPARQDRSSRSCHGPLAGPISAKRAGARPPWATCARPPKCRTIQAAICQRPRDRARPAGYPAGTCHRPPVDLRRQRSQASGPTPLQREGSGTCGHNHPHARDVLGHPDLVIPSRRLAVFVDGDMWHGNEHRRHGMTSMAELFATRTDWWVAKFQRNMRRDQEVNAQMTADGWTVIRTGSVRASGPGESGRPSARRTAAITSVVGSAAGPYDWFGLLLFYYSSSSRNSASDGNSSNGNSACRNPHFT